MPQEFLLLWQVVPRCFVDGIKRFSFNIVKGLKRYPCFGSKILPRKPS